MSSRIVRCTALWTLIGIAGCVTGRAVTQPEAVQRDWGETLARAEVAARDHRYAEADRLLADFANRYPGTTGAVESAYWRGVIALEPSNRDASPQMAAALFDTYAKSGGALPHRMEAEILRDLALRVQSGSGATVAVASNTSSSASSSNAADLKAKDTEIQRLKDELAKANDELERIKRRLTAPTKP
jgi:hypothetical protein